MGRDRIIAKNKRHLSDLIDFEIQSYGPGCDLNHIDVSGIETMSKLFEDKRKKVFNGDISGWDVSNVKNMAHMFKDSAFNGDISRWDVSGVEDTRQMFNNSQFNGDISQWDVSSVESTFGMFAWSAFNGDISKWDLKKLTLASNMFMASKFKGDVSEWRMPLVSNVSEMFDIGFTIEKISNFNPDVRHWVLPPGCISDSFVKGKSFDEYKTWYEKEILTKGVGVGFSKKREKVL